MSMALVRARKRKGSYLSARAILKRWGMPQRIFWEEASAIIKSKIVEARRSGKTRTVVALTRDKEVLKRRLYRVCSFPGCGSAVRGIFCNVHRVHHRRPKRKTTIGI